MQLTVHEAHDLNELTLSCVNSITHMSLFLNQAQDAELKSILQRHFDAHVQDYNTKVSVLSNTPGAGSQLPIPEIQNDANVFARAGAAPQPVTPRTNVQAFNDREIGTAYLLTLKRAGREYAWAAMESSNPAIRTFLEDAFRMCSRHAFEVWQWMAKNGFYPVEAAPQQTMAMLGNMYEVIPPARMMQ